MQDDPQQHEKELPPGRCFRVGKWHRQLASPFCTLLFVQLQVSGVCRRQYETMDPMASQLLQLAWLLKS